EPACVPDVPGKSKLYQLLVTSDEDDRMPQKDDPLPAEQIARIRQWIEQGCKFDGADTNANLATFVAEESSGEPPAVYPFTLPITALAYRGDGKTLASSGYHEILLWDAEAGKLVRRVKGLPQKIQRLAFSPDGK